MKLMLKTLTLFFVLLLTEGCSQKLILVPRACHIPKVDTMVVSNSNEPTTLGEAKQCATNYFKVKQNYDILSEAIQVCQ